MSGMMHADMPGGGFWSAWEETNFSLCVRRRNNLNWSRFWRFMLIIFAGAGLLAGCMYLLPGNGGNAPQQTAIFHSAVMAAYVAACMLLLVLSFFSQESVRVDEDGFRYVLKVLEIPLWRKYVRVEETRFFWMMPVKKGRRAPLILRTSGMPVRMFGSFLLCTGRQQETAEALRQVMRAGNHVLARLKGRGVVAASDEEVRLRLKEKPEVAHLDGERPWIPAEHADRPSGVKWRMTETRGGVMFRLGNREVRTWLLRLAAVGLVVGLAALGRWFFIYWYYVICEEPVSAHDLFRLLGRLLPACWLIAVFVLAVLAAIAVYWQMKWWCRWAYFGVEDGRFRWGGSLWGETREDTVAVAKCEELVVFDDDELAITGPPAAWWKAGKVPSYVVQVCKENGVAAAEVANLTRDEARWMRDEIMSKIG